MELFVNGCPAPADTVPRGGDKVVALLRHGEEDPSLPGVEEILEIRGRGEAGTRFESHENFDYISVLAPDPAKPDDSPRRAEVYLSPCRLVLVHEDLPAARHLAEALTCPKGEHEMTPPLALCLFFGQLTRPDAAALEDIEEEIANLEDAMMGTETPGQRANYIGVLRWRLLVLKRYYEALLDLLQDMEENQNGFLDRYVLRLVHLQTDRADRLSRAVLNLRDYVTQVRESYQAQLDISLNETMKLFTVITAVFLPLTLITGWFGMNLKMAVYDWPWATPAVVAGCIVVAALCLWYFRRKKWF